MTNMELRLVLATLVVFCLRTVQCGEHPDGISQVSRAQDALGNYQFSYAVSNNEGEQFRKEGTDPEGRVVGSYGLTHHDGTHRVVDYVADKHGFRAEVRSNEPGVASAESADAKIIRTDHPSLPLTVAATSGGDTFGKRLKTDGSKVAYEVSDTLDETVRESRQSDFDDYRPLSPVAYYPTDVRGPVASRPSPPIQRPVDLPRSSRVLPQTPDSDSKPMDVYYPPIDPHSAIRRPATFIPRDKELDRGYRSASTSRKPFIPPYGGFDDDPLPEAKHPGISMTTIHGGLGSRRRFPHPAPTPSYGSGRYPSDSTPDRRDFSFPKFPPISPGFPSNGQQLPHGTPLFSPPSYEGGIGNPNFVLRAVPIPNGIQAVMVDPDTGRIYERLAYPLYLRHDGHPAYDRNILLHNDDVSDDDATRDDTPGYFDIPFPNRAAYRGARDQPFEDDDIPLNGSSVLEDDYLDRPTAADLAWVRKQLSMGDDDRLSNGLSSYRDTEPSSRFSSQLRMRHTPGLFDYRREDGFSRNPRQNDRLSLEETSTDEKLEESASVVKPVEASSSQIEKEGN